MQNVHFSPPQIAQMFSVNVSTIKRWVNKGFLEAELTPGGHRRITQNQLEKFLNKFPKYKKNSYIVNRFISKPEPLPSKWKEFYNLLKNNRINQAEQLIEKLYLKNLNLPGLLDEIIGQTLRHIGNEWAKGNISIYEEHRMSFLIRLQLVRLEKLVPETKAKVRPKAILACAFGEQHEIPLQMLTLVLRSSGWEPIVLGINTPIDEVIKAVQDTKASLVAISKIYNKPIAAEYINKLAKNLSQNVKLIYGGTGWSVKIKSSDAKFIKNQKYFKEYIKSITQ